MASASLARSAAASALPNRPTRAAPARALARAAVGVESAASAPSSRRCASARWPLKSQNFQMAPTSRRSRCVSSATFSRSIAARRLSCSASRRLSPSLVAGAQRLSLAGCLESLGGVFADRLEHREPLVGVAQEALVDERLEGVEIGLRHLVGRLERGAAAKDRETGAEGRGGGGTGAKAPTRRCPG